MFCEGAIKGLEISDDELQECKEARRIRTKCQKLYGIE